MQADFYEISALFDESDADSTDSAHSAHSSESTAISPFVTEPELYSDGSDSENSNDMPPIQSMPHTPVNAQTPILWTFSEMIYHNPIFSAGNGAELADGQLVVEPNDASLEIEQQKPGGRVRPSAPESPGR